MNLYEFEGKNLLTRYGIRTPKNTIVYREDDIKKKYAEIEVKEVVIKAQILAGKRGKNNGIRFCATEDEVVKNIQQIFSQTINKQYVHSVLIEEKILKGQEYYLSLSYDTNKKQPMLITSVHGGIDIEDVSQHEIQKFFFDIRQRTILPHIMTPYIKQLWECFINEDLRVLEINPFIEVTDGSWIAADAKIALDDDAFFRHPEWNDFELRTVLGRPATLREIEVQKIDKGKNYYRGTAGKYIELDGNIAVLFSGGGASIANMDALIQAGCKPANYTEYSGNPPREKINQLAKIVLSKPGLKGLWIAGGVANFTNIEETFQGIIEALDELKPKYPIVVRRAGPREQEGMRLMEECAVRNNLIMKLFGKETTMTETAQILASMVKEHSKGTF